MKKKFNGFSGMNAFNKAYIQLIKEQTEEEEDLNQAAETENEADANDEAATEENDGMTTITFKTNDQTIIDAFNSGFASATLNVFVKSENGDEEGEDETEAIEIDGSMISDVEVISPEDEEGGEGEEDVCPECGNNPCTCDDEEDDEEDDEVVEDDDEVVEDDDDCPDCDEDIDEDDEDCPDCDEDIDEDDDDCPDCDEDIDEDDEDADVDEDDVQ